MLAMKSLPINWLQLMHYLASPRLTIAFFLVTAVGALLVARAGANATLMMTLPFTLLVINTVAAVICKARFRADPPLLLFHLALLILVVLLVLSRLVYFQGGVILSEGTAFSGDLTVNEQGALHQGNVGGLRFQNEGFTDNFRQRSHENITYNQVRWWDDTGTSYMSVIGDDRPLILDGYRIYTTRHRGFAPLFYWQPEANAAGEYGTVQLEDKGGTSFAPAASWQLRGGPDVWLMLVLDKTAPEQGRDTGNFDTHAIAHKLIVRFNGERHFMDPGGNLELEGGRLSYVRLDSWMGYRLVYEPLMPWLVATVAVGVFSLLWLYTRLFFRPVKKAMTRDATIVEADAG